MKLISFLSKPFTLIDSPKQKLILISICLGFGIIFTNIFIPFNVNQWEQDKGVEQFFRLTSYYFIIALSLLFTQFIVRRLFKVFTFSVWRFILWFLGEVTFIALIYLLVYSDNLNDFWETFTFSFQHTLLGISIPYLLGLVILALVNSRNAKSEIQESKIDLIGIPDEKGVVKVSLQLSSILYFEAADNYITIFYLDENTVKQKLIRNSLKNIESVFPNSNLKRCHRSYIVNVKNIKLIEKVSRKHLIHVKNCDVLIPISPKYVPLFKTDFS